MPPVNVLVYRDLTEWKNAPMDRLILTDTSPVDVERYHFYYPTQDSTWNAQPITQRDDRGANRLLGYNISITFKPLQNNIEAQDVFQYLDGLRGLPIDVALILKPHSSQMHGRIVSIVLTTPHVGDVVFYAEPSEQGPQLVIQINGVIESIYQYDADAGTTTFWVEDSEVIADAP